MSTATIPTALTGTYVLDASHSRIGFAARHAMVSKVRGSFNEFEGSGYFDAEDPTNSKLSLIIQAASIDTRNADRDGHLKSCLLYTSTCGPRSSARSASATRRGSITPGASRSTFRPADCEPR